VENTKNNTLFSSIATKSMQKNPTLSILPIKILIVEDNPVSYMTAKKMLTKVLPNAEFIHVGKTSGGQEAIDYLSSPENKEKIDLIVMDEQMPVMDGHAATLAIRNILKIVDIPIATHSASAKDVFQGAQFRIEKPIKTADELLNNLGLKEIIQQIDEKNNTKKFKK
jgi:CheY-like chemotaxis protein